MTQWARHASARLIIGLLALGPILVLLGLLVFAPPDGAERAELLQFIGRFHPLSVHIPIALLLMVPLLELAGRNKHFPFLLPSVDFLLGIAMFGAIGAASLGWCLARAGAYSGPLVVQHMWGGVSVAAMALLCWGLRPRTNTPGLQRLYAVAIVATVGVVSFTGYRGGQLSQGENHLTQFMPAPLASVLRMGNSDAAADPVSTNPTTLYGARIQPILAGHCVTCHGSSKHKSNLRLDTYAAVMRGGKHGPVIKAGETKASELFRRITLPQTDDDFMPAENRRPLSASDTKLIELWIASGASATQSTDAANGTPSSARAAVAEVTFEDFDAESVAKRRASVAPIVSQLQQRMPNVVDYQSRGSADVVVNASWMGAKFGDNELAALAPLSGQIIAADFSSTAITDRSAGTIATMKRLRSLRLMHTKITDTTIQGMGSLDQLESLSIFDTPVTPAALPAISRLPKLRQVYVDGTKISSDAAIPQEIRSKLVF
jgi:uncharacterized membrane protein